MIEDNLEKINEQIQEYRFLIQTKERKINEEKNRLESLQNLLEEKLEQQQIIEKSVQATKPSIQPTITKSIQKTKQTPFDTFYNASSAPKPLERSEEYLRLLRGNKQGTETKGLKSVSISHTSDVILNEKFVEYTRMDSIFGLDLKELDFNPITGVFTAPSYATYIISVIALSGQTEDIFLEFSHPKSPKKVKYKIPDQPTDVSELFNRQENTDISIPDSEIFVYNIVKNTPLNQYALQAYRRAIKRNQKLKIITDWRQKQRAKWKGTGFFHFPAHTQVRLARELRDEIPEFVTEEAFSSGPVDMIARTFKLIPGTKVSVIYSPLYSLMNSQNQTEKPTILFNVGLLNLLLAPPDKLLKKIDNGELLLSVKNVYSCYKCGRSFETSSQLLRHMISKQYFPIESPQKPVGNFISPHNGKRFYSQRALDQHIKSYRPVKCTNCRRRFFTENRLKQHLKDSHKNTSYRPPKRRNRMGKCPFYRPKFCCVKEACGGIFMDAAYLRQHHKDFRHYSCSDCSSKFFKKSDLFRHTKAKHDLSEYNDALRRTLQRDLNILSTNPSRRIKDKEQKIAKLKQKIEKLGGLVEISPEEIIREGNKMEKSLTSHCVINIVPPRDVWGPIQSIRTAFIPDARCGPHFSFLDPFITLKHFPEAAKLLAEELSTFKPFRVYLNKLNYFVHSQTVSLFLEPITEPPNSIENLLERCLKIFPQCNDLVLRSKTGKYQPHMTIAKFTSEEQLHTELAKIKENWNPISFEVKELYFLHRYEGNPFEVRHVIPLGSDRTPPFFGPGSIGSKGTNLVSYNHDDPILKLSKTCLVCNLPPGTNRTIIDNNFTGVVGYEILKNPDGRERNCGVIEFKTQQEAIKACEEFSGKIHLSSLSKMQIHHSGSYLIHLPNAVFPCYGIEDCCSLNSIRFK